MAVNGIEIQVGQTWKLRGGGFTKIESNYRADMGDSFPWIVSSGDSITDAGRQYAMRKTPNDLVELISGPGFAATPPTVEGVEVIEMLGSTGVDMTVPGYEKLANVLQRAYNQAAVGKGVERHATVGEPFDKQVMQIGAAKFGVGALLFQAFKKSEESQRLEHDRAVNELLGAIVYLAGAVIAMDIKRGDK
jgi:hypothetical protein